MAPHICMMVDVVYLFEQTNKERMSENAKVIKGSSRNYIYQICKWTV